MEAMGHGRVIGVDIEIRPDNRAAIEGHPLFRRIAMIQGDSASAEIASMVSDAVGPAKVVMVVLDSGHSKQHVLAELRLYSPLVSVGSYIVVCDGIMETVVGAPGTKPDWNWNNPRQAALEFVRENPNFCLAEPGFPFNEGVAVARVTYWPDAFLRRIA
jgi:cephalosporin hydroxylase